MGKSAPFMLRIPKRANPNEFPQRVDSIIAGLIGAIAQQNNNCQWCNVAYEQHHRTCCPNCGGPKSL